jgi:MerR family transcriptional regulator, thiopeptide resistance regulator
MNINDYSEGSSDEQVEKYREEVRRRWGEDVLKDSDERVLKMGKERLAEVGAEGDYIFKAMCANMLLGCDSPVVQQLVACWQVWLENFSTYSDDALLGLGRMYSDDPRFADNFRKYHDDFPAFLTKAIEHYISKKK